MEHYCKALPLILLN